LGRTEKKGEGQTMESLASGTFVGAGSFRCRRCGYVLTLEGSDTLTDCPGCAGRDYVRASLFSTERLTAGRTRAPREGTLSEPAPADQQEQLAKVRAGIEQPGQYLCYSEGGELRTVALTREWTRIGRSLAADVRFDDPTVSRRHALIVRQPDGVRVLDDRSLNGVFVNGARVEGKVLKDGDEIIVGRYRLSFLNVAPTSEAASQAASQTTSEISEQTSLSDAG
jgi:pSer/pThr/pTyr-binding forkhead associated (FHA) protein